MLWKIILIAVVYAVCALGLKKLCDSEKISEKVAFYLEVGIVFVSVYSYLMFAVFRAFGDVNSFVKMMTTLTEDGFYGVYENGGIIYPPVSQIYFWAVAKVLTLFGIPLDPNLRVVTLAIKLPCIICVFLMAWIVYRVCKRYAPERDRVLCLFLILLNPGFLFTTGYVCQVDAFYTFLMLFVVWLLVEGRTKLAYFVFACSIMFKFQTIFITPIIAFAIIDQIILDNFKWKNFWKELGVGLCAIGCMGLFYLPFVVDFENGTYSQGGFAQNFSSTIAGFGKASQNAYNFWTLLGYNELPQTEMFGLFSCQTWGTLFIVLLVALSIYFYIRERGNRDIYPMLAALLVSGTYCFAVRMMSRYLYPAVILLFLGYAMRPTKKRFVCALLMAVAFFVETAVEYLVYPWRIYTTELLAPYIISGFCIACFGFLVYTLWSERNESRYELV